MEAVSAGAAGVVTTGGTTAVASVGAAASVGGAGDVGGAAGEPACPDCLPPHCTPGNALCIGNRQGTCGADGTSLGTVTRDCIAEGKACTPQGNCTPSVEDEFTLNASRQIDDGEGAVNYVDVFSARRVLKLSTWIDLSDDVELRWEIAEWHGQAWNVVVTTDTFVKFNALHVTSDLVCVLEAGKRYRFSVTPLTPTARFEYTLVPQPPLSFGAQVYPDAEPRTYAMDVTTNLP